jgi:uncharacterized SAM-binding protein YcdF (DUF218 family)
MARARTAGPRDARAIEGAALAFAIATLAQALGVLDAAGVRILVAAPVSLAIGAALGHWRVAPLRWLAGLVLLATAIGAFTPVSWHFARRLVRDDTVALARTDAILVFSNVVTRDGLVAGEGVDRLLHGLALRRERPTVPLVVSIVRDPERTLRSSLADQRALAELAGGPPPIAIDSVYSTHDEAIRFADTARARGWKRVVAITSPMHSRRACATVARQGLAVTCSVAPWRLASLPPASPGERLWVTRRLVYESFAWAQYAALGWAAWNGR